MTTPSDYHSHPCSHPSLVFFGFHLVENVHFLDLGEGTCTYCCCPTTWLVSSSVVCAASSSAPAVVLVLHWSSWALFVYLLLLLFWNLSVSLARTMLSIMACCHRASFRFALASHQKLSFGFAMACPQQSSFGFAMASPHQMSFHIVTHCAAIDPA